MNKVFLFYLLLFVSFLYSEEVCIINFNKELCGDFKLLPNVIVKTKLSKSELKNKINKPIKQIAFLENTNLFLIEDKNSLSYSKKLEKEDFIIYAQPNISQKRNNNTFKSSQNIEEKYNLNKIWKQTKGEGVNIAIIDDGFDLEHEDLKDVNVLFSYDVDYKTLDAKPKSKYDTHGTQVAGVIFATHNNIGANGIAPNANLIAIRQSTNITSDTILAFTVAKKAGADIINCSWNSPILLEPIYDMIKYISKDTYIVFAAGNNNKKLEPLSIEASIPEIITVGANKKYSNYGDMIDFIIEPRYYTTKKNNNYSFFGGTSSAAPIISALIALKVSVNLDKNMNIILNELKKDIK